MCVCHCVIGSSSTRKVLELPNKYIQPRHWGWWTPHQVGLLWSTRSSLLNITGKCSSFDVFSFLFSMVGEKIIVFIRARCEKAWWNMASAASVVWLYPVQCSLGQREYEWHFPRNSFGRINLGIDCGQAIWHPCRLHLMSYCYLSQMVGLLLGPWLLCKLCSLRIN